MYWREPPLSPARRALLAVGAVCAILAWVCLTIVGILWLGGIIVVSVR